MCESESEQDADSGTDEEGTDEDKGLEDKQTEVFILNNVVLYIALNIFFVELM